MAILLFTGCPGSGKSYSAIQLCLLPALDMGRPICTNIPLHDDEIRQVWPNANIQNYDPTDDDVWDKFPGGALILVDEVGKIWPGGSRADRANPKALDFISMHRHRVGPVGDKNLSQEVVIISQGSKDIASWVRSKVDKTYVIKKQDAIGADKSFRVDVYQGFQDTAKPLKRDHIRGYLGKYSQHVYDFYQSHTQGSGDSADAVNVLELKADAKATIWNSWTMRAFMASPLVLLLAGLALYFWFGSHYGPKAAPNVAVSELAEKQATKAQLEGPDGKKSLESWKTVPTIQNDPIPKPPSPSIVWRVMGFYKDSSGLFTVLLQSKEDRTRFRTRDCTLIGLRDITCTYNGELVTYSSGSIERSIPIAANIPGIKDNLGTLDTRSN